MIIYTSGSTGQPKGVMQSFERASPGPAKASPPTSSPHRQPARKPHHVLPAAGARLRARLGRVRFVLIDGNTHVFFAERWTPSWRT
jgi:hypothetical protein